MSRFDEAPRVSGPNGLQRLALSLKRESHGVLVVGQKLATKYRGTLMSKYIRFHLILINLYFWRVTVNSVVEMSQQGSAEFWFLLMTVLWENGHQVQVSVQSSTHLSCVGTKFSFLCPNGPILSPCPRKVLFSKTARSSDLQELSRKVPDLICTYFQNVKFFWIFKSV